MRLTKYRIKRYASNCKKYYIVQEKFLFFWLTEKMYSETLFGPTICREPIKYDTYEEAMSRVSKLVKRDRECKEAREWAKEND